MIVKDLKEILAGCDDNARIFIITRSGHFDLIDEDVHQVWIPEVEDVTKGEHQVEIRMEL